MFQASVGVVTDMHRPTINSWAILIVNRHPLTSVTADFGAVAKHLKIFRCNIINHVIYK